MKLKKVDALSLGFILAFMFQDVRDIVYSKRFDELIEDEQGSLIASRLAKDIEDDTFIHFIMNFIWEYGLYTKAQLKK